MKRLVLFILALILLSAAAIWAKATQEQSGASEKVTLRFMTCEYANRARAVEKMVTEAEKRFGYKNFKTGWSLCERYTMSAQRV